jgi:arylsulfatase A-like enzyme
LRAAGVFLCSLASCGSCKDTTPTSTDAGVTAPVEPAKGVAVVIDANAAVGACTLGHLGALVDLGDPSAETTGAEVELVEREGASWAKITGGRILIRFTGPTDASKDPAIVDVRVRGNTAKRMTMTLNGKLVGDVPLSRGDVKTMTAHGTGTLLPGANELVLRFNGLPRQSTDPSAEIDWIHVGTAEEGTAYVPPTHLEAFGTSTLAGVPRRGYSVRGPGFLRCTGVLPDKGTFEANAGMLGEGEADVEARLLRDRQPPLVLGRAHVRGGEAWKPMSFPIDLPARVIGAIELAVASATPGARVLLAEARVTTPDPPAAAPPEKAKSAILVVLGSLSPRAIAPYGGPIAMPELSKIADAGALFESHRAASTWPASSLASMLTGLSPRAHGLGERTMLDGAIITVADAAKQAGIATALFTANPTTGADYGFSRPFATFLAAPPGSGPMTGVFDEAARFLREHADQRTLVVVHARGAHPPWEASAEEVKKLPPDSYTGPLDPQHSAELVARAHRSPPGYRLTEADKTRAIALQELAFSIHDTALGRLMTAVRELGHDPDTLVVVTSDVGLADHAFLSDADPLDEALLSIPLVLRGPGATAKSRIATPTTSADLARTLLVGLGLEPPTTFGGADVRALPLQPRPVVASLDAKWSLRWLGFSLKGDGRNTMLCDLLADPACATDAQPASPLTAEVMRRTEATAIGALKKSDPAYPSAATITALHSWGR